MPSFIPLAAPENPRWEDGVAVWNSVTYANRYWVQLSDPDSNTFSGSPISVTGTMYNFNSAMVSGKTYRFRVYATHIDGNYPDSATATSGTYKKP